MSFLTSLSGGISTLIASGLTPAQAVSAVSSLFGGVKNTVTPMLSNTLANYDTPAFVANELNLILQVQNINDYPAAVAAIKTLPTACAAAQANPAAMSALLALVQNIENQL